MGNKITRKAVLESLESQQSDETSLLSVKTYCAQFKQRRMEDEREFLRLASKKGRVSVCEWLMKRCETEEESRRWNETALSMIVHMKDYLQIFKTALMSHSKHEDKRHICGYVLAEFQRAHVQETHPSRWLKRQNSVMGFDFWQNDTTEKFADLPPCYPEFTLRGRYFNRLREIFRNGIASPDDAFRNESLYLRDMSLLRLCIRYQKEDVFVRFYDLEDAGFPDGLKVLVEHGREREMETYASIEFRDEENHNTNDEVQMELHHRALQIKKATKSMFDSEDIQFLSLVAMCIESGTRGMFPTLRAKIVSYVFDCITYRRKGKYMWLSRY